jgi:hypothetical protein
VDLFKTVKRRILALTILYVPSLSGTRPVAVVGLGDGAHVPHQPRLGPLLQLVVDPLPPVLSGFKFLFFCFFFGFWFFFGPRRSDSGFRILDLTIRAWGFRVAGFGFRVPGLG